MSFLYWFNIIKLTRFSDCLLGRGFDPEQGGLEETRQHYETHYQCC